MKLAGWLGYGSAFVGCVAILWMVNASHHVNPGINPASTLESQISMPREIGLILQRSCNDCHSNNTRWPWYSRFPLVRSQIKNDVDRARETMNFSEWPAHPNRQASLLMASCFVIRQGIMPPGRYIFLHPDTRVSNADADLYCAWANRFARTLLTDQISKR